MRTVKQALVVIVLLVALIGLAFSAEQKPAAPPAQPASEAPAVKASTATTTAPAKPTPPAAPQTQGTSTAKTETPAAQAAPAAQPAPATPGTGEVWASADESDWAVYMDAPAYHFALVKEYLQKGDHAKAAVELRRANEFLNFQKKRLSIASKQIEELANKIAAGKEKDVAKIDAVTSKALKVIDQKFAMLPIEVGATSLFADEYKYHFEKAKSKYQENDRAGAAAEIKRAISFMKLKAVHIGHKAKADLDAVTNELKDLATKVESGTISGVKDLEQAFQKAIALFAKKK